MSMDNSLYSCEIGAGQAPAPTALVITYRIFCFCPPINYVAIIRILLYDARHAYQKQKEPLILFLGDVALFYLALWLSLTIRYQDIPSREIWGAHLAPFSILFVVWVCIFFIAGLYEKHTLVLKSRLPAIIFYAHAIGSAIAVSFFISFRFSVSRRKRIFLFFLFSRFSLFSHGVFREFFSSVRASDSALS